MYYIHLKKDSKFLPLFHKMKNTQIYFLICTKQPNLVICIYGIIIIGQSILKALKDTEH